MTRTATRRRETGETSVEVSVNLDGSGNNEIATGIPFFDHMLDQVGRHGGLDLTIRAEGDLAIDTHPTVEDALHVRGQGAIGEDHLLKHSQGHEGQAPCHLSWLKSWRPLELWRTRSLGRTIGPATSCGKKVTKRAKFKKLRPGLALPR